MFNFDYIAKEDIKEHNPNSWPFIKNINSWKFWN